MNTFKGTPGIADDTAARMREHVAKRNYVLVRNSSPFHYYGQRWDGEFCLCKDFDGAKPVLRWEAASIINSHPLSYAVPIGDCHAAHLARTWTGEQCEALRGSLRIASAEGATKCDHNVAMSALCTACEILTHHTTSDAALREGGAL